MNTEDGGQVTGNPNLVLPEQFRVCMGVRGLLLLGFIGSTVLH